MAEATLNYQTIRTTHAAREADDLRVENRKKNLIILVLQWLAEEGYVESARQLEHETNLDVTKYDVCDNIDLDTILQEYESYFYIKFNKYPKLTKKNVSTGPFSSKISAKLASTQASARRSNIPSLPRVANNGNDTTTNTAATTAATSSTSQFTRPPSAGDALRKIAFTRKLNRSNSEKINAHLTTSSSLQTSTQQLGNNNQNHSTNSLEEMSLSFMKVSSVKTTTSTTEQQQQQQQQQQNGNKKKFPNTIIDCRAIINDALRVPVEDNADPTDRLLKPLGGFTGYNSEWRELAEVVSRYDYKHETKEK
ncbi:unnamed protein product [Rotaria magnacalcarata]|uniref:LisH domain-containing protein n=1 Tax=Rotaria magnacalcarata TaxID=392030 RepID=A0A816TD02_9BILA|nr:unnamed protein product [Rotaria magnacalcarata]CAF2096727.1 unnamed protein product [Rotaria magnacalcarata]CAF3739598.1 unnamed protein product [Rotaria magnacalcarata]CAF3823446.1 unnamed protein product [Rotaria magnacalcarata]